jgi:hypothetical protein
MGSISSIASSAALTAAQVNELTVDVGFTTNVAGKTYDADVVYFGGQYIANDADLTGAEATGTTVQTAESNFITRIDALV